MITIGVDTAARVGGAAAVEDGRLLGLAVLGREESHSEHLLPSLSSLLERLGRTMDDVGAIAVGVGPGSFTGLRIGLAAVKGIAYGRGIPVVGVSTLLATAWSFAGTSAVICASLDARRESVFAALYDGISLYDRPEPLTPESREGVEEVADRLVEFMRSGRDVILAGDGSPVLGRAAVEKAAAAGLHTEGLPAQELPAEAPHVKGGAKKAGRIVRVPMDAEPQRPANVAHLGEVLFLQGRREDLVEVVPNYLRLSEAERRWKQMRS